MKRILNVLFVCILAITLVGCSGNSSRHEGEAKTPSGSRIQKGRDYQEVIDDFEEKGFKNIKTELLEDLITGWLKKDGEVESVTVDGNENYAADVWYPNDVEVVITYHTFPTKVVSEDTEENNAEEKDNDTSEVYNDSTVREGEAKTPSGSKKQKGRDFQEVIDDFEEKGFKNIKTAQLEDLITGWLTKDGEVESVTVDGDEAYSPDVWYPDDVEVIITYHTFPKDDEKSEIIDSVPTMQEDINGDNNENEKTAPEVIFTSETAKRVAVVAMTNGHSTDVFKADGNHYDPSKFHSYADVSGDYMTVYSDGVWTAKDDHTWHVDNLKLEINGYSTYLKASLDVSYDGKNYIVSNVTRVIANLKYIDSNDPYKTNIEEMEPSESNLFLIVSEELIKDDRQSKE